MKRAAAFFAHVFAGSGAGVKRPYPTGKKVVAHHWSTRGAVAKQAIVDAFKRLPAETEDDETEA